MNRYFHTFFLLGYGLVFFVALFAPINSSHAESTWFERRQFAFAKRAFQDHIYDVSQLKIDAFLKKYPESEFKHEARWLLAQCHFFLGDLNLALEIFSRPPDDPSHPLIPAYQFWKAETLSASKQVPDAIKEYRLFLNKNPEHELAEKARVGLSKVLFQSGNSQEALDILNPLLEPSVNNTTRWSARLQAARIAIAQGRFEEGLERIQTLLQEKPSGTVLYEASFLEGEARLETGRSTEALAAYRRITSDNLAQPRHLIVSSWLRIGDILSQEKKWSEASAAYEGAFRTALDSGQIQQAVLKYLQAQYRNQTLTKGAMEIRNFAKKNPQTAIAGLYAIGKYYFDEKKYDAAISELHHLIEQYPASSWVWNARLTLAESLLALNQKDDALSLLTTLSTDAPEAEIKSRALAITAETLQASGDLSGAAKLYQSAAQASSGKLKEALLVRALHGLADAGDLEAYQKTEALFFKEFPQTDQRVPLLMKKASLFEKSGQADQARTLYIELASSQSSPQNTAEALYRLGLSAYDEGKTADALAAFEGIEQNHPDFAKMDESLYLKYQCEHVLQSRPTTEIHQSLLAWVERFPNSKWLPDARNFIGNLLEIRGLYAEAVAQYRLVIENYPKTSYSDQSAYWAGKSLLAMKQYQDAIVILETIQSNSTWKPYGRIAQILCYMRLGDYTSALKISDSLISLKLPPAVISFAQLRRAECLYTLAANDRSLYPQALQAAEAVLAINEASSVERNEAGFIKGEIYQKMNQSHRALEAFLDVVYGQVLPMESTHISAQPESHWFIKSGLAAARIRENQGDIRGAVEIYRILERLGEPNRDEFRRKIEDLKNEHFLYENS
ncbi:MAG: tetratricopeptide repeat protein [Candidatus Methylacidiphilales bacterium]